VPTLRPLAGRFIPHFATSNQSSKGYQQYDVGSKRNMSNFQTKSKSSATHRVDEMWDSADLEMAPLRTPPQAYAKGHAL
jgi:hypothetical protein